MYGSLTYRFLIGAKTQRVAFHFAISVLYGSVVSADTTSKEVHVNWLEDEMSVHPLVGSSTSDFNSIDALAD